MKKSLKDPQTLRPQSWSGSGSGTALVWFCSGSGLGVLQDFRLERRTLRKETSSLHNHCNWRRAAWRWLANEPSFNSRVVSRGVVLHKSAVKLCDRPFRRYRPSSERSAGFICHCVFTTLTPPWARQPSPSPRTSWPAASLPPSLRPPWLPSNGWSCSFR